MNPQMNPQMIPQQILNQQHQFQRPHMNMNMGNMNIMAPPPPPQPIVVDGISVTPVEISNQEKDMVFAKVISLSSSDPKSIYSCKSFNLCLCISIP